MAAVIAFLDPGLTFLIPVRDILIAVSIRIEFVLKLSRGHRHRR